MQTITYVPTICEATTNEAGETQTPKFNGSITLRRPTFDDRFAMVEDCGVEMSSDGAVTTGVKNLVAIRRLVKKSAEFYQAVDLTRASDGARFSSFEDLSYEPDCSEILIEVATFLMNGQRVSKN